MSGKNLTQDQINSILELKSQGKTSVQISSLLNISQGAVLANVTKLGLTFKNLKTPRFYKQEILNLLEEGKRPIEIAKELGLNTVSTNCYINQVLNRTFALNQGNIRYFQNIDTRNKAYFLGFIAADGAIVGNALTITIHSKDRIVLETLKSEIGNEHKIQEIHTPMGFDKSRRVNHVRFTLYNNLLISDLNSWGIFPKKSLTIDNIIPLIPYEFRDAFIIGYLDGDGSVTLPKGAIHLKNGKFYPSYAIHISFRGTKDFLQGILNHLGFTSGIYFHKTFILSINHKKK